MTDLRQVCEEILRLGRDATERPWGATPCYSYPVGNINSTRICDIIDDKGYSSIEDGRFTTYACNNIESVARSWLLMREVLEWYAHPKCVAYHTGIGPMRTVVQDNGSRARDALARLDGGKT